MSSQIKGQAAPIPSRDRESQPAGFQRVLKQALDWTVTRAARALRAALSLPARKRFVKWLGRRRWPGQCVFAIESLQDFAKQDSGGFHRFLWSHHLAYAHNFEISRQYGSENLHPTRRMFFEELMSYLRARGIDPDRDVQSAFEVGCSVGHLLRFAETELFRSATTLRGIDIDKYAVENGARYLRQMGSKVELVAADVMDLDRIMGAQTYDIVLCCAVLTFLNEETAARVVEIALRHARLAVAMLGVAHPLTDNANLLHSDRCDEEAFVHNLDRMVQNGGGKVALRRWEGARMFDGHTFYLLVAEPPDTLSQAVPRPSTGRAESLKV